MRLALALIAPAGIALMGLVLGSPELFLAGAVFTGLVLFSAFMRRSS